MGSPMVSTQFASRLTQRMQDEEERAQAKQKENSGDMLNVLARALIERRNNIREDVEDEEDDVPWDA